MIRKSKLLVLTFVMLQLPYFCLAQTQQPGTGSVIELIRADAQADRAKTIATAMNFNEKDVAIFWPIYRKYEYERSTLDDRRVGVIKGYAAKRTTLSGTEAKALAERMMDCDAALLALKKKYFKKFNEVLPALTVATFFQLEHRMDLIMDMKVESSLPPLFSSPQPSPQVDSPVPQG